MTGRNTTYSRSTTNSSRHVYLEGGAALISGDGSARPLRVASPSATALEAAAQSTPAARVAISSAAVRGVIPWLANAPRSSSGERTLGLGMLDVEAMCALVNVRTFI